MAERQLGVRRRATMRSFLARCLVALLGLALLSGNAHARLWIIADGSVAPHMRHHAGISASSHDQDETNKTLRGCCDCIVSAFTVTPNLGSIVPAVYGAAIRYRGQAVFLHGRILLPEPEPPRPGALS